MNKLAFLFCLMLAVARTNAAQPMNLLVIQTDEHNFRTLGCYRDTLPPEQALIWGPGAVVETPAIDSIAARGVVCTSYYATSPVCTPSRASFFTGRYPQNTGSPANDQPLHNDIVTFAAVLSEHGYSTGYAGKWHLDGSGKPQWAPKRQFGFADNRFMFNRGHWKKFELTANGPRVGARKGKSPTYALNGADEETFSTDWLTSRAIDFIKENAGKPFCYHLSLPDPHGPNTVRAPYDTMYANMVIKPPLTFSRTDANPKWAPGKGKNSAGRFRADLMSQYFGMVRCIDDNVARILATLKELNISDQTAIVFTSDHGDLCFEHGRLNKGNPYEGSAKIPMIIMAPEKIAAGKRIDQALGTVDFAPTMLPLLGFDAPVACEGRDFGGLLNKTATDWKDITILRNGGLTASWVAAVTDRHKLVFSVNDTPWLFDLENDPDELTNAFAAPSKSEIVELLSQELLAYSVKYSDPYFKNPKLATQIKLSAGQ